MLHLIISTPRSGSNSLCRLLAGQYSATNLYEPVTDHRNKDNELTTPITLIVKQLIERAKTEDVVAKFHVNHLLMLYPQDINVINDLFSNSKLYYCFRLNFTDQVKSIHGITETGICDARTDHKNLNFTGAAAKHIVNDLINEISIMGEWYKSFSGELCVLENKKETYSVNGFTKYNDTYSYTYDSAFTQTFVEQHVDVLEVFNKGNTLYKLFRGVRQSG